MIATKYICARQTCFSCSSYGAKEDGSTEEKIFTEKFSVHGSTLPLLLLMVALRLSTNGIVSALYPVIAWIKGCFHMQSCLVFSASALDLIVALFEPGGSHLLPIGSGNVAVADLRVKIMGVVSSTKVSNIFPIPQDTFQTKQAHLVWCDER